MAATVAAERRELVPWRELWLGAAVTALCAAALLEFGPAPGDAAAHLYRTLLVQHGAVVWDNYWYGGQYPLASYSLLYYLPAALVGNLPLVLASAVVSTVLFASIAFREWGEAALWPSRVFAILAAAPAFTGLYTYSLGFAAMLGTLRALQGRRTVLALLLAALTVGFSPLAFAFLCLIAAAVVVPRRRVSRRLVLLAAGFCAVAGVQAAALLLFPSQGVYPYHWAAFGGGLAASTCGVLLARHARRAPALVWFYALWGVASVILFVVPSPVGDNWTRLDAFILPLMLLTAALAEFRPRRLTIVALVTAFVCNAAPYLLSIPLRLDNRPAHASFWQPAIAYLHGHLQPGFRVEVVPTAAHWEAYWIPRAGIPLARGFYQQIDEAENAILYSHRLTPSAYERWLRRNAVAFVLRAETPLDWNSGTHEARLLSSPASGLQPVFRDRNWTIYALKRPTPLLTGAGKARVTYVGHTTIRGSVASPGRYLLRVRFTPYWSLRGHACLRRGPSNMVSLLFARAGAFKLFVPTSAEALFDTATRGAKTCRI